MSEQSCRHMREAVPTGACYVCAPWQFMYTPEQVEAMNYALYARRRPLSPEAPVEHGEPQQAREQVGTRLARPATAEPPAAPAATPPPEPEPLPDDPAPWQELTRNELALLQTLIALAGDDGLTFDQLNRLFIDGARQARIASWTEDELREALTGLQRRAYAGPYDTGEWAPSGKGKLIIADYKRRYARVS